MQQVGGKLLATIKIIDWTLPESALYPSGYVFSRALQAGPFYATLDNQMKAAALLLLAAGWMIVLAAIALLPLGPPRAVFVWAGVGVEIMGSFLLVRSHYALPRERG